ncbi:uncharacterized protein LOC132613875 isoform X2 [Lycium barbarum]|uniref:uncharacterized protein LOC132613875 isoform X2 n=1 Tax=Lycium barbarum TaxID=112863 RepID=UPI00293F2341|nr:uncharacterized protein LOC132613875 isoform X2 [Lycium barbarum]
MERNPKKLPMLVLLALVTPKDPEFGYPQNLMELSTGNLWCLSHMRKTHCGPKHKLDDNRYISNNWYTMLVNGSRHGFFKSGSGLTQGDPLSPNLFVLSAELLSKMLNALYIVPDFSSFSMHNPGPQVNHLSFADDTIIFSSGKKASLQIILNTVTTCDRVSGQLINKDKCSFTMAPSTTLSNIKRVGRILHIRYEHFIIKWAAQYIQEGKLLISFQR